MSAYYNEIEPFAAEWLENLSAAGKLAPGRVDRRSIRDVKPSDLEGVGQAHFFAGIGGWSHALRLAGWPDDTPVWTGSCPCQPFSNAGRKKGIKDERHLWPEWFRLIRECKPDFIFSEQVASPAGRAWFDSVSADLEGEGYAIGALDLCAAGVGAPHIRQRLYFVGVSERARSELGDSGGGGGGRDARGVSGEEAEGGSQREADGRVADEPFVAGSDKSLGNSEGRGKAAIQQPPGGQLRGSLTPSEGFWSDVAWLPCRDGKSRPTKPGLLPLAHGVPGRVGKLRAIGNAIVPQVAATFIRAVMDCKSLLAL